MTIDIDRCVVPDTDTSYSCAMTTASDPELRSKGTRKEQAAATRERILDAAHELLSERGYLATTMAAVAARAGVAIQTVYFVFHTKSTLLRAVLERSGAGDLVASPLPWLEEALDAPDGQRAIALIVEHGVDLHAHSAMLARTVRQIALTEPDVRAIWTCIDSGRKADLERVMTALHGKGLLRDGLPLARATDICHAVHGHETYLELVVASGWDVPAYKAWLYETLCCLLLDPAARVMADAAAVADLSSAMESGTT